MTSDYPHAPSTEDKDQMEDETALAASSNVIQDRVSADVVHIEQGGVASVEANAVTVNQGGIQTVQAEQVQLEQGGIAQAHAREIVVSLGGVGLAQADHIALTDSHAGVIVARTAEANNVQTGFLFAGQVNGDVQAAVTGRSAAIFGLVVGVTLGAMLLLFRRR